MKSEVCAVVITYHPDEHLGEHLALLISQVKTILIVDNHSSLEELAKIRAVAHELQITLVENTKNVGIGAALNQAVVWVNQQTSCEFVLFFDQDSSVSGNFVECMIAQYRESEKQRATFVVTPSIVDRRTGETSRPREYGGRLLLAQTSGGLMPMRLFKSGNLFKEDLFIDYVDYEFCLRMTANNWCVVFCERAELLHQPGNVSRDQVNSGALVTTWNYSPLRHYYLTRNRLWVLRTYIWKFPVWGAITLVGMLKEMVHVLRFEKDRRNKIAMWWCGFADACHSRLGQLKSE